jgi:chromosome segregation ATPase
MEAGTMSAGGLSDLNKELMEIKTSLVSLEGTIKTLNAEMRSGDKDSSTEVRLLSQALERQMLDMNEYRRDLKETTKEFRDHITSLTTLASAQASAVRVDLEAQLLEHEDSPAPHQLSLGVRIENIDKELGARLTRLEHESTKIKVVTAILVFIGWGGVAAIVKFLGN